jgi:outer membrane protein OmpA-like peptidoglycan-associated protein
MRLTPLAKAVIALIVVGVVVLPLWLDPKLRNRLFPAEKTVGSNVPPPANLPELPMPTAEPGKPGCADLPEVRFYHWAWNAQMGLMHATGGKQAVEGSAMCKNGVNLKLIREDSSDNMQAAMVAFAEALKKSGGNPDKGAHFVCIMGDGSAPFLKGLNDKLAKLGPDYTAAVVGSTGYSRGEDKLMGPPAWKKNPQAARGGLVAGVLRDGDWNIALKWLGDNKIPNNPNEKTYDPDALNWVNAGDYIDAAQKYVSGYCTDLKNIKSGKTEKHCVDGVVTWTPGDVTVAQKKGGLASIVSTREYRSQMPSVIIGNKKWMAQNRKIVAGLLRAAWDGADIVRASDEELQKAAAVSAVVYGEKDTAYWYKYFRIQNEVDPKGVPVDLGGSAVSNLADNLNLFGMAPGSTNLFAATYTVFAEIVKSQYPELLPGYYPVNQILDTSYLKEVAASDKQRAAADTAQFSKDEQLKNVVSRRSWDIQFATGSDRFTPEATAALKQLFNDLVVAGGTLVEVHGHTDNQGAADNNQKLSEARAFAVKTWLEKQSPTNFPDGRIRVFAHGMSQPLAPNTSSEGRAKNRRVELVLGTAD